MNRQVASSIDVSNAGAAKDHFPAQPGGKRKALSILSSHSNNTIHMVSKHPTKASFKSGLSRVPVHGAHSHLYSEHAEPSKPALMKFQVFSDEQDKENTRPGTSTTTTTSTLIPSTTANSNSEKSSVSAFHFFKAESPGAQEDREEEEIIVVDSPMVVDSSLGNLSLKEHSPDREFLLTDYSQEIYTYLKEVETRVRPRVNYMRKQTDISVSMRRILVDWLVEVSQEYKLDQETLYLSVFYIDRFLSCMAVLRNKLQLVGTACMFIAAKFEEIYPPDVSEFVYITDDTYTKQQVLRMEHLVLKVLAFDLAVPTANFFLQRVCALCKVCAPTQYLARYLCELCLLEADPFLKYLPSETACAALALANHTMGKEMWSSELQLVTEYTEEDFRECLENMYSYYLSAESCPQQAIQEKYKSHKYHSVSSIIPPPSLPPTMRK